MNKQLLIRVRERVKARLANASIPAPLAGTAKNGLALTGFASLITFAAMQANPQLAAGLFQTAFPEAAAHAEAMSGDGVAIEAVGSILGDVAHTSIDDKSEQRMAEYLSSRFRVSREAMSDMVRYAGVAAEKHQLDLALVLAVAAVESGFNPYAASPMGAKGLMQVMSTIHHEKFKVYSDVRNATTNPQINLMVGAEILRDCISRGGSVNAGLKLYLGVGSGDDGGYVAKVISEAARIRAAATGRLLNAASPRQDAVKVAAAKDIPATPVPTATPVSVPAVRKGDAERAIRLLDDQDS